MAFAFLLSPAFKARIGSLFEEATVHIETAWGCREQFHNNLQRNWKEFGVYKEPGDSLELWSWREEDFTGW